MAINEQDIANIVRNVLKGMETETPAAKKTATDPKLNGIFETPEEAIAAAKAAQKEIQPMPLEFREKIIANIRKKTLENGEIALGVVKNGKVEKPDYQVDGISGGTITSVGVDAMLKTCLNSYKNFLTNNNEEK